MAGSRVVSELSVRNGGPCRAMGLRERPRRWRKAGGAFSNPRTPWLLSSFKAISVLGGGAVIPSSLLTVVLHARFVLVCGHASGGDRQSAGGELRSPEVPAVFGRR